MRQPLDEQQLTEITTRIGKVLKNTKQKDIPSYSEQYKELVELTESVAIHAEYNKFPEKLFREKAPNEDPDEFKYRKGIYKQRTLSFWNRALSTINRIWNHQNFSIEWKEDDPIFKDSGSKDFFLKHFPDHENIISYFSSVVTPFKIKDPNAVLFIYPESLPTKEDVQDGKPVLVFDDTQLLEPEVCIYPQSRVIEFDENNFVVLLSDEFSEVSNGNKTEKTGLIYYVADIENYYRITQYGKKSDFTFSIDIYYTHNLGFLPAKQLKGKPAKKDDGKNSYDYYQSYFMDAIPYLDIATSNGSNLDMSTYTHAFPERWEYVESCPGEEPFVKCLNGWVGDESSGHRCGACKGTGYISKHSPLGVYQIQRGETNNSLNPADNGISIPPFGYEAPDSAILEFLEKRIKNDIIDAFTFMNIDVSNSEANGQSDTALGKKIDREELFSFISQISKELFDLLRFTIKTSGLIRYSEKFEEPVIKEPNDFAIRSESDLTEEISNGIKSGLPSIAIRKMVKAFMELRFNTSHDINRMVDVIMTIDRLATMNDLDINANISVGRVAKWEAVLHDSIASLIEERLQENPQYLEQEMKVIKTDLVSAAKALEAEINPVRNSTESILGSIAGAGAVV